MKVFITVDMYIFILVAAEGGCMLQYDLPCKWLLTSREHFSLHKTPKPFTKFLRDEIRAYDLLIVLNSKNSVIGLNLLLL